MMIDSGLLRTSMITGFPRPTSRRSRSPRRSRRSSRRALIVSSSGAHRDPASLGDRRVFPSMPFGPSHATSSPTRGDASPGAHPQGAHPVRALAVLRRGWLRFRHHLIAMRRTRACPNRLGQTCTNGSPNGSSRGSGRESAPRRAIGYHLEQAYRYRSEDRTVIRAARRPENEGGRTARIGGPGPSAEFDLGGDAIDLPDGHARRGQPAHASRLVDRRIPRTARAAPGLGRTPRRDSRVPGGRSLARGSDQRGQAVCQRRCGSARDACRPALGAAEGSSVETGAACGGGTGRRHLREDRRITGAWRGPGESSASSNGRHATSQAPRRRTSGASSTPERPATNDRSRGACTCSPRVRPGARPRAEGIRRCERFSQRRGTQRIVEARGLLAMGVLTAMEGRFDEARRMAARGRAILGDVGSDPSAAYSQSSAYVEMLAGEPRQAERELRSGYADLRRWARRGTSLRLRPNSPRRCTSSASSTRPNDSRTSARTGPVDDYATQVEWRGTRAKVLARRGEFDAAVALAEEAVALAEDTDYLNLQGDICRISPRCCRSPGRNSATRRLVRERRSRSTNGRGTPCRPNGSGRCWRTSRPTPPGGDGHPRVRS